MIDDLTYFAGLILRAIGVLVGALLVVFFAVAVVLLAGYFAIAVVEMITGARVS